MIYNILIFIWDNILPFCAGSIATSLLYRWQVSKIVKKGIDKYIDEQIKK
jgi:hypothetical protein